MITTLEQKKNIMGDILYTTITTLLELYATHLETFLHLHQLMVKVGARFLPGLWQNWFRQAFLMKDY
jgi:hypothetical protein